MTRSSTYVIPPLTVIPAQAGIRENLVPTVIPAQAGIQKANAIDRIFAGQGFPDSRWRGKDGWGVVNRQGRLGAQATGKDLAAQ